MSDYEKDSSNEGLGFVVGAVIIICIAVAIVSLVGAGG